MNGYEPNLKIQMELINKNMNGVKFLIKSKRKNRLILLYSIFIYFIFNLIPINSLALWYGA